MAYDLSHLGARVNLAWHEAGKRLAFGNISGVENRRVRESTWAHAGVAYQLRN
jgi:hypothetical protein